jgi:Chlamydia-phage Chp2 scaffold (Chlamy_scaf).
MHNELRGIQRRREVIKGTDNFDPSLTQQQFADETDINQIMKRYHETGMVEHLARNPGKYVDLADLTDYQGSLQKVIDAESAFMTLPSETRFRFQNNPQELINFLSKKENLEEAIKLKLIDPSKK